MTQNVTMPSTARMAAVPTTSTQTSRAMVDSTSSRGMAAKNVPNGSGWASTR